MNAAIPTLLLALAAFQADPVADAVASLQHGDLPAAEQTLRAELRAHPANPDALGVLAIVLDQEKKFADAAPIYRRALAVSPHSAALFNNYGNHLLASGKPNDARAAFLKVLELDPAHVNARVQLARIALESKAPAEALRQLDALERQAPANQPPDVPVLRMQALFLLHRDAEAEDLLARLSKNRESSVLASALVSVGRFARAEELFSQSLAAKPGDFATLYSLGLAASHAGHNDRAREVLQSALDLQPENPDVLYDLAAVDLALGRDEAALPLLVHAAHIVPDRPAVQRLLAHTAGELGYYGDAIHAWDRYLALVPADDAAARDRAFAVTALGENVADGVAGLQAFVRKHPRDAVGLFELGAAQAPTDAAAALRDLDRSLAIDPDLVAARVARGLIRYRQGDYSAALPDFEAAAHRDPENPIVLDRLGQTDLALGRPADALPFLRKAAQLAPRDSRMQLHLGRALADSGNQAEADLVLARVRELGADKSSSPHPAGLVDFINLPPAEQMARYRAGVERTVALNPENPEAQVRYLQLLLADGKLNDAAAVVPKLAALHPSAFIAAETSGALVAAEQYGLAREFLASAPSDPRLDLDRALVASHLDGPTAGLSLLDRLPASAHDGDFLLASAAMLAAAGQDPRPAITAALAAQPSRPGLFREAALALAAHGLPSDANRVVQAGLRKFPDDADLQLAAAGISNPRDRAGK